MSAPGNRVPKPSRASHEMSVDAAGVALPVFDVRCIRDMDELEIVHRITYQAYLQRGYCRPRDDGKLLHYPEFETVPQTTVIVGTVNGLIVGTVSITLDGPLGLPADHDFHLEMERFRTEGKRMAGVWRMAVVDDCLQRAEVATSLIRAGVHTVWDHHVDITISTFNPRHERLYARILNYRTVARTEQSDGLENAPAVLMRLDTADMPEQWKEGYVPGKLCLPMPWARNLSV